MSDPKDKDQFSAPDGPDRSSARDKTVLKIAGSPAWPSKDDGDGSDDAPAAAQDPEWTSDNNNSSEAEAGSSAEVFPEVSAKDQASSEGPEVAQLPGETKGSDAPQPDTDAGSRADVATREQALEPVSQPEPSQDTELPEDPGDISAEETEIPPPEDAPEEPEQPLEARIEVPVQQQYASLLAALSERIEKHPGGHDLLAVLRMLEGQTAPGAAQSEVAPKKADEPAPPRIGKSRRLMEDIVRFGQDPSSEFAPSTIERAARDSAGGLVLLERFLGLLGPQGALPSAYNDEAIMRGLRGDDSFPRFLDVFNNRFVQLFFRAWADARPIVQHDRPDDDRFLGYLGSAIGIGSPIYRNLDRIDDRLKLLYAGLTSPKNKSAARLQALITGVFGVKVEIEQCVGTWLHLDKDDQLSLGGYGPGGAGRLGADTIVGARVFSVSDKIRIRIFTRTLDEYRKFLPPTRTRPNPWTEKLFDLIDFYLGLEVEYEIELALPKRCASSVQMNAANSATLGHIGWLKPAAVPDEEELEAEGEEEEMLTDTRFRPVRRHTTVYQ